MTDDAKTPALDQSSSPILFLGISKSYLRAFELLWQSEFEDRHPFYWDRSLIFHPISHLLGLALETSIKGLIACRGMTPPRTHDLEDLLARLNDPQLESQINDCLADTPIPKELVSANKDAPLEKLEEMYRRYHFHFHTLNRIYARPYATRYPVLGWFALPDPNALAAIVCLLHRRLEAEARRWRPTN